MEKIEKKLMSFVFQNIADIYKVTLPDLPDREYCLIYINMVSQNVWEAKSGSKMKGALNSFDLVETIQNFYIVFVKGWFKQCEFCCTNQNRIGLIVWTPSTAPSMISVDDKCGG